MPILLTWTKARICISVKTKMNFRRSENKNIVGGGGGSVVGVVVSKATSCGVARGGLPCLAFFLLRFCYSIARLYAVNAKYLLQLMDPWAMMEHCNNSTVTVIFMTDVKFVL